MKSCIEKYRLPGAIFFLSLSVLMFELSLVRLFSIAMYSSVAFMSVSFALFGLALGGMVVYFAPKYFSANSFEEKAGRYAFWYGVSLVIFILLFLQVNFASQGGGDAWHGLYLSGLVFYLSAAPFFLANICLSYIFKIRGDTIGLLYFSDLIGAGLGVIAAVVFMGLTSTVNVVFLSAGVALISAALLYWRNNKWRMLSLALIILIFGGTVLNSVYNDFDITYNKKGKEENVIFSKWNSFSRVTVKKEAQLEHADSLPEGISLSRVEQMGIEIDSDAYTPILRFDGDMEKVAFLKYDLSGLAYRITPKGSVLIIGPGGGRDVLSALLGGNTVRGVEINPIIAEDIMKGEFRDFSGSLYLNPKVDVLVAEGRSFIHNDTRIYSVIQLPLIDTWASTLNGNFALVENYLYTVEALEDYLSHLTQSGMLSLSRWELDGVRLIPMYIAAAEKLGIERPERNIVVVKNAEKGIVALNNYLFKKEPFSEKELDTIDTIAEESGFEIVYSPRIEKDNAYYRFLAATDKEDFMDHFDRNIRPSYDDKPFFFFVVNPSQLFLPSEETIGRFSKIDGGLGEVAFVIFLFVLLLVTIPFSHYYISGLYKKRRLLRDMAAYLGYFSSIGFGFLILEMVFIQKFILYLEQPIYSYSVVLATILLCAGMGSYLSKRLNAARTNHFLFVGLAVAASVVVYVFATQKLILYSIGYPIIIKIIFAVIINAPIPVLMGIMLPLGLRRLSEFGLNELIPYCWGMNGALSVLASVVAIILVIFIGFQSVLFIGAFCYLLPAFFIALSSKNNM